MSMRLKGLVGSIPSGTKDLTILLVYNWERTSQVIRKAYGSDDCPIDRWKIGPLSKSHVDPLQRGLTLSQDQSVASLRRASRRSHSPESRSTYPNASNDRYDGGRPANHHSSRGSMDHGGYSSYHDRGSLGPRAYSSRARHDDAFAPITLPAVFVIDVAGFSGFCLNTGVVPANMYDSDLKIMLRSHWKELKIESSDEWCAANECWWAPCFLSPFSTIDKSTGRLYNCGSDSHQGSLRRSRKRGGSVRNVDLYSIGRLHRIPQVPANP
jgi:hypothetical protein